MNTNTGRIYEPAIYESDRTAMEVDTARGDIIVPVSPRVARLMKEAHEARRRRAIKRRAMQHASRKRNR
jgi:hypothetical protein